MLTCSGFWYVFVFVWVGGFLNTALPASFMPDARLRSHGPGQTSYSLCNCLAAEKGLLLGFCVILVRCSLLRCRRRRTPFFLRHVCCGSRLVALVACMDGASCGGSCTRMRTVGCRLSSSSFLLFPSCSFFLSLFLSLCLLFCLSHSEPT